MNKKVVPINRGMFLSTYCNAQNGKSILEEIFFGVGFIATVLLPQIILSIYGGIISFISFATVVLVGLITGLVIYRHITFQMPHCIHSQRGVQSPPHKAHARKNVA